MLVDQKKTSSKEILELEEEKVVKQDDVVFEMADLLKSSNKQQANYIDELKERKEQLKSVKDKLKQLKK